MSIWRSDRMKSNPRKNSAQSGQVIITGVIMLVVLLLLLLTIFDVHNLIRSKFKFETAQQSAALAGANWQKNTLNLIGEINLLKACAVMLEGEKNWDIPLPPADDDDGIARRMAIQGRLDQLTEMQTRVSFIGPVIGYAAAQQAAKANGMRIIKTNAYSGKSALDSYMSRLQMRLASGSVFPINNYDWYYPYTSMLSRISESGVAVLPNARGTGRPVASPSALANSSFYREIMRHKYEIEKIRTKGKRVRGDQSSWRGLLSNFVSNYRQWSDHVLKDTRYWDIDFNSSRFPNESEIFTVGVQTGFSSDQTWEYEPTFSSHLGENDLAQDSVRYPDRLTLPGEMKWFCYDSTWYPQSYMASYSAYQSEHFDYWFGGTVLRDKVKSKYIYEGAAAYAEASSLQVDRAVRFRPERKYRDTKSGIITKRSPQATTVGTKRSVNDFYDDSFSTSYRPGAIAKPLGELTENRPPIAIPIVLPVFDQAVLMPTYMPIPVGFEVLRNLTSPVDDFLAWLAEEDVRSVFNYKYDPPAGTDEFLLALQILSSAKEFRNYGWNGETTVNIQELLAKNSNFLLEWSKNYQSYVYAENNQDGLGWLQEPRLFSEVSNGKANSIVDMPDNINGGTAQRHYVSKHAYYVVDSTGRVMTNIDSDPTIRYTTYAPGASGGGNVIPSQYDASRGPARI